MHSLSNVLGIARNAIAAHQVGMQAASQNISNAQTEGYSRQRVSMSSGTSIRTPLGPSASGVQVQDIARVRDSFLDQSYRRDSSKAASYGLRRDLLQRAEGVFAEPSETGVGATLDAFWSAWSDLANEPTSTSARNMVRQRGTQLTSILNHTAGELATLRSDARSRLDTTVGEINRLGSEVALLNDEIVAAEVGGRTANDLRDRRDLAVDALARLASVRTTEQRNGSLSVIVENVTVVDGGSAKTLAVDSSGPSVAVRTSAGSQLMFQSEGSSLGAVLQVLNTDIPGIQSKLDDLAEGLVTNVNALFGLGNGGAGGSFFDPTRTTADTIVLDSAVLASASAIPTGYSTAAGDNTLALDLAALQSDESLLIGGATTSFATFYRGMIADLAVQVSTAENSTEAYAALASQSETRRQSVSGVSIDEELIRMMQHQQAYTAATRVVSAVDEMLRSLLSMV